MLGLDFTVQIGDGDSDRSTRFGKVNKRLCMILGIPAEGVRAFNSNDPRHFYDEEDDRPLPLHNEIKEDLERGLKIYKRVYNDVYPGGVPHVTIKPMITIVMDRPPELRPPSFMFLQLHTTGLRCVSLGHRDEISCWALQTANSGWTSIRSNNGIRKCTPSS